MFNTSGEAVAPGPIAEPINLDLNFLPERYRGRRLRLTVLRPWLFLLGFSLLLIPSAQLLWRHTHQLAAVEADLATVSGELEGYQPLAEERSQLEGRTAAAGEQAAAIEAAYQTINVQRVTWSELIPRILSAVPDGLVITLINHSTEEVTLEGLAAAYELPSAFADGLEKLPDFSAVIIQSVEWLTPEQEIAVEFPSESEPTPEDSPIYTFQINLRFPSVATPEPPPESGE